MVSAQSSQMAQPSAARHWCGTLNNYDAKDDVYQAIGAYTEYLIVGIEGRDKGTPHLQIYLCLKVKQRLTWLKKQIPRCHWEIARGTAKQASDYCKKEGEFYEMGTLPRTAGEIEKTRWEQIHTLAKANAVAIFFDEHAQQAFLNPNKFQQLVAHYRAPAEALPIIDARWYIGPSGSGKSLEARREFPMLYLKPSATKWWPDYEQ